MSDDNLRGRRRLRHGYPQPLHADKHGHESSEHTIKHPCGCDANDIIRILNFEYTCDVVHVFERLVSAAITLECWILLVSRHGINHAISSTGFNLKHPGPLSYIRVPQQYLWHFTVLTGLAGGLFTSNVLKKHRRTLLIVVGMAWSWLWMTESALYNNHYYLYTLLFSLTLITSGLPRTSSFNSVAALRLQLVMVYVFAAIAKMDSDWLNGSIAVGILSHARRRWIYALIGVRAPFVLAWGGLIVDLICPIMLLHSHTHVRSVSQLCLISFHALNTLMFGVSGIGAFSMLMTSSLLLFPAGLIGCIDKNSHSGNWRKSNQNQASHPTIRLVPLCIQMLLQLWIPLMQFYMPLYTGVPVAWGKQYDRFSWRMKSTLEALSLQIPPPVSQYSRDTAVNTLPIALCELLVEYDFNGSLIPLKLLEANGAQREEICVRPSALVQYTDFLKRQNGDITSIHVNVWLSLNGHAFQPRYNSSINLLNEHHVMNQLVLPWSREYGSFDPAWRPVWQLVHARYHNLGFACDFFSLSNITQGRFPWLHGIYLPQYIEVLAGSIVINLLLQNGQTHKVLLHAPKSLIELEGKDLHRAEFPPAGTFKEWWVECGDGEASAFFALAWEDAKNSLDHVEDRLSHRLHDYS